MTCLAITPNDRVSSGALAERTQVPQDYLSKVLQLLARASLIAGRRGVGGGYRLARPATEITMIEVVNAVEPVKRIERCPLGMNGHNGNLCPLHRRMDEATKSVIDILNGVSLDDLLNDPASASPLCEPENGAAMSLNGSAAESRVS